MRTIPILVIIVLAISVAGCSKVQNRQVDDSKLQAVATFYPLYYLTNTIGGDKVEVLTLIPAGVEPHDYEPTPIDIIKLSNARVFVTLGLEFSPIEDELKESAKSLNVIDSKKNIPLLDVKEEDEHEEEEKEHEGEGKDPHIWLSPKNMITMANNINQGLKAIDPENADYYQKNTDKLVSELQELDNKFKAGLSNCKKNIILTNHKAYAYLSNEYGFEQIGISGIAPESEPTPQELVELEEEARKHNINYVFTEELVDPRIAQTIAKEIGAQTMVLSPLEGIENIVKDDYITVMNQNLASLRIAMECS